MFERVLVPLDGSTTAAKALEQAEALAEKLGSSLILLRVVHTLGELAQTATPSLQTSIATSQDVIARSQSEGEKADARAYLSSLADALRSRGVEAETRVVAGEPAAEIIAAAKAANASLIAMTPYGAGGAHTRAQRSVFGGVADEVMRQSPVATLIVRP